MKLPPALTQAQDCLKNEQHPSLFPQLLQAEGGRKPGAVALSALALESLSFHHLFVGLEENLLDAPVRNASSSLLHTCPVAKFSWKGFSPPLDNFKCYFLLSDVPRESSRSESLPL